MAQVSKFSCTECTLYDRCIPKHISVENHSAFENVVKRSRVMHKGDFLHHYDDPVKALYIIRSGSVKEFVTDNHGEEHILAFYLPGEMIGLDSLGKVNYRCMTVALETTTYCAISIVHFEQICQQFPDLQKMMFNTMSKVISFENKMLLSICNKKANERIAAFLISLLQRYSHLGYSVTEVHLPMSRHDIGNYLGLTSETVSRVFTQLQKENIISVHPKMVTINNMTALNKLGETCSSHKIAENVKETN